MKLRSIFSPLAAAAMLSAIAGCQTMQPEEPKTKAVPQGPSLVESDPAMLQLVSIAQNLHERTAINDQIMTSRYGIQEEARVPVDNLPSDLKRIISYPGGAQLPLETALKDLCQKGNISYIHPQGKKPLTGIYVIFDGQLRTVAEFIADAARQAGYRADVVFDITAEPNPSIQIIYKGAVL
ncbi:hypothetical protein [Neptuniibacter halophilus]|uniref:hypothetical protein n=1 Tax=Neptuniibacter halophilus TaxID=651666 RepID=UPI002572EDC2|nr:hypothetical protein [Neptuniibacter halophilus]